MTIMAPKNKWELSDMMKYAVKYTGPVLIIHGTEDPLVAPSYSIKAARLYRNCELRWIDGAGHGFYSPEQRELYFSYSTDFLNRN